MKKTCLVGIVTGVILVILGVIMLGISVNVRYNAVNTSFGGDFYTYQYRATIEIGETIEFIGSSAFLVGGIGTIAFGVLVICYFKCKLLSGGKLPEYSLDKAETSNNKTTSVFQTHLSSIVAELKTEKGGAAGYSSASADSWICKTCHTRNMNYVNTCKCGQSKIDN